MAKPDLKSAVVFVLKKKLTEAEAQVNALKTQLAFHENTHLKLERHKAAAENQAEILFNACRILASAVDNTTSVGRRAREEARELLESNKLRPPGALGSSRSRGKS